MTHSKGFVSTFKRVAPVVAPLVLALQSAPSFADGLTLPPISIGAGMRTSFTDTSIDGTSKDPKDFSLDSVRLYVTGSATDWIKLTFNTEYTGSAPSGDDKVLVMDAIARFEYSPEINVWAGRFLPPSDRANLYGPYYANHWGVYRDAVQDGYANTAVGRDNGIAYWGDFANLKVSAGAFDVPNTTAPSADANKVLFAGRVQYDFWDKESGYFLNSTYYGAKDLLAVGAAIQNAGSDSTSYSFDLLVEKNLAGTGTFTLESEYAKYEGLTGGGVGSKTSGAYALLSYVTPQPIGIGRIQVLGKYAQAKFDSDEGEPKLKTTEVDLGYIVKEFNVRGYLFYIGQKSNDELGPNATYAGVGLQVQI